MTSFRSDISFHMLCSPMLSTTKALFYESTGRAPKSFPKVFFDLKAFRKGITEKKTSLMEAEKREIARAYAKPAPEGWSIASFLEKAKIAQISGLQTAEELVNFHQEVALCFDDWNDFISSDKKDLMRVSNLLSGAQVKKLAHCIELFNHGLFELDTSNPTPVEFMGKRSARQDEPWTSQEDETLIDLAVQKYDYTFGDVWLYVSREMMRTPEEVQNRFVDIYIKPRNKAKSTEVVLSKSFRPLLMNRQFRVIPPQCYIVPSEDNFPSLLKTFHLPEAFQKYRHSDSF